MPPGAGFVNKNEIVSLFMKATDGEMNTGRKDVATAEKPAAAKASPVQRRAYRTRASLLEAVETIVAEQGAAAVTTTSIAAHVGVSVGTLYRYYTDREELLLAAYDATVERIVAICGEALSALPEDLSVGEAARALLGVYLDAAEAIPAHAGLLKAMRAIRTIEADQTGASEMSIVESIFAPFFGKYAPQAAAKPERLHFMAVLIGNLVDLYLLAPGTGEERTAMRREVEAHLLLALERMSRTG